MDLVALVTFRVFSLVTQAFGVLVAGAGWGEWMIAMVYLELFG